MTAEGARRFPPARFSELSTTHLAWVRPVWLLAFVFAIVLDIMGTAYVIRDVYERDPHFAALGLISQIDDDGSVLVESAAGAGAPAVAPGSRLVAVNGKALPPAADTPETVEALIAAKGPVVELTVRAPDGTVARQSVARSEEHLAARENGGVLTLDQRMAIRLATSLVTCLALIGCAALLFLRRPYDPVCLLFSFAFLLFAATIDPPLTMWLGTGWGTVFDWVSSAAWLCLVLGIAVFPDGRFEPRWIGWLVVILPLVAGILTLDALPLALGAGVAFIGPLILLGAILAKYRKYPQGIERQQIKWAAWGFAAGLTSTGIAFLFVWLDIAVGANAPLYNLLIISLFTLGFLMIAAGILIGLLRFRLWEADRVISRSAIYTALALSIGIVWAASMDLLKMGVEYVLGEENKPVATMIGAVLAAGVFAPAQAMLLKRTKTRFDSDRKRIEALITRLAAWRTTETPGEIASRALSSLASSIHAGSAALLVDRRLGRDLLAARDVADPEALARPGAEPEADPRFVWQHPLEDEDGPVGLLLVGPRSDANRYNEDERANCLRVLEPLAEALRVAIKREAQTEGMQRLIGSVEERLARLETGGMRPAAT